MSEPIVKLTRGIPKTDREWMDVFSKLTKHLKVVGDQLVIQPDIQLPDESVSTIEIEPKAVTNSRLRDSQGCSVIGRSVNTTGQPSDIQSSVDGEFLRRSGAVLGFGAIADGDIPATIARDTEVSSAITAHEAASDPHPGYTTAAELSTAISDHSGAADPHAVYPLAAGAETISGAWSFSLPPVLPSYTVAGVPSAATYARGLIYVSNETGGAVIAFSDGTNWRRVTDRAVIA
jgi:hypothetical protein